ncbi:MAG TPA: FAD-dependent oxidoreductase [Gaiellaceae bacterium]|nr:FAD-dependent oxidoreductase [Gaiellaceae bacterium]
MTRTAASTRFDVNVLVVGGGVAGLEAALALRALGAGRVGVEILAPELHFYYRPLAVSEPFGGEPVRRWELADLARSAGADFTPGELAGLDAEEHTAHLRHGPPIAYDAVVLACGARPETAVPGALTFRGPADVDALRGLVDGVERAEHRRLVFVVPTGIVWPLPLYELALQTAAEFERRSVAAEIALVTSEPAPLALFGAHASEAVAAALAGRGIKVRASTYAESAGADGLAVRGGTLPADAVVALPRLSAPEIEGVPRDRTGFVPTDPHGRVPGVHDVYAAGDLTAFPIKQGGLAAQQADAVAETIAAAAGAPVEPRPFRPVLRALLLTGAAPTFLRVELGGGHGETSEASEEALWWPPGKIVGRYLAPFLAELGVLAAEPGEAEEAERIEIETASVHELGWPRS